MEYALSLDPRYRPGASAFVMSERRAGTSDDEFDEFFQRHYSALVRSLTLMTGDSERAIDGAQEAFIKAYASWSRVRDMEMPLAWVRRVAINKCHDSRKADRRRRRRELGQGAAEEPAADGVVGDVYVLDLLQQLPSRQRAVAVLFYVDDLPVADVASAIGISEGTVKFHLNQARERLRAFVDDRSDP